MPGRMADKLAGLVTIYIKHSTFEDFPVLYMVKTLAI
jgi:hypothetical protein